MLVDFDDLFIEHALQHGFVKPEQIAEARRIQKQEADGGRKYYLGQILIRRRALSCADFLEIENALGQKLYECMSCKARYGRSDLTSAGTVQCKGCGAELKIEAAGLSIVEILASRDPRDLTISLCPTQQVDPKTPIPSKLATSTRLTALGVADPPRKPETTRSTRSKLNRAVLELSKEELSGLARYEVLEELGRGGMGIVFKARQVDIDRICGLKVIKASANVPEVQINRFVQEARAAAQLNHPNIVTIYDFGRYRDMFYIAMEFIEGRPLAKVILEEKLPTDRAISIACDILDAVSYAHGKGVIHRDLKPQNILVENDRGRGRLIDFGLAKDFSAGLGLTQTGQILGSPFYLSPEQTRGESRNVDPRSDVFAMGVILYEMLTKTRPFTGKSAAEVYGKILKERPAPPSAVEPDVDPALQEIVLKALEKEPRDRFQTAEEFRKSLLRYREERDTSSDLAPAPIGTKTSGALKPVEGIRKSGSQTTRSPLAKRASDRDTRTYRRTSANVPVAQVEDRRSPPPPRSGSRTGLVLATGFAILAVAGAVLSQASHNPPVDTHVAEASPSPSVSAVVTGTDPRPDPSPSLSSLRPEERAALRELELSEERNASDWGTLLGQWKELGDRFPSQKARADARRSALFRDASVECTQILLGIDSDVASKEIRRAYANLAGAIPRFEGTDWEEKLQGRKKELVAASVEVVQAACKESDDCLARHDFVGAIKVLTVRPKTELVPEADALIADQWKRVSEAEQKAKDQSDDQERIAAAHALEEIAQLQTKIDAFVSKRDYDKAKNLLDEILNKEGLPDDVKGSFERQRAEVALLAVVIVSAQHVKLKPEGREVEIEVSKTIHGVLVRVQGNQVTIRTSGGGESDFPLTDLPAWSIVRIFELSYANVQPEGWLAKALFLLHEGEPVRALAAFEEAKKRGADVSTFEPRFADLDKIKSKAQENNGTQTGAASPSPRPASSAAPVPPDKEKPVSKDSEMLVVPAGEFVMGVGGNGSVVTHEDQWPARKVRLPAFAIDRYEVSNHQYAAFLDSIKKHANPHRFCHESEPKGKDHTPAAWGSPRFMGDAHPVVGVDWYDAFAFSRWAQKRLPTEAEWERAARGTDERTFPWGGPWDAKKASTPELWFKKDVFGDADWAAWLDFSKTAPRVTVAVNELPEGKSAAGCYNMAGNVAEWVQDWYAVNYYKQAYDKAYEPLSGVGADKNPQGPEKGTERCFRGGSWTSRTSDACSTTFRSSAEPRTRELWLGFRCAKDAEGQ